VTSASSTVTPARGRFFIVLAALLWSTSGAFTKLLTADTPLGLNEPPIETLDVGGYRFPVQIVCYRCLLAGLAFVPALRPHALRWQPLVLVMGLCFTCMSLTFISAQALGTAANAILLQYSAPLWMYLASILFLGEQPQRRNTVTLLCGLLGIGIIVAGGWQEGEMFVIGIGLASGVFYACVILCLRVLRNMPALWLTVWNHLFSGLVLVPLILSLRPPTAGQFVVLMLFGVLQMSAAYWLMARGLQAVSPQEAGTLTLLEPLLNPIWTYFMAGETPSRWTFIGGGIILAALAWRYWPFERELLDGSETGTAGG
jgi:drug/metabolite transporter (DMT)-like permease